jgi:hypothetical protein
LGGLDRSSRRFDDGGCDGEAEAWFEQGAEGSFAVPWSAGRGRAGGSPLVLAGDRGRPDERGCRPGRGRGASGRIAVVPGGGRHAAIASGAVGAAAIGASSGVHRARGDRASPRPGIWRA